MLEMSIYVPSINDEVIKKWQNRFRDANMTVEIHPDFSFTDHTGFLPFKVIIETTPDNPCYNKVLLTGFELVTDDFNLEVVKSGLKPQKTFFQSLFKGKEMESFYVNKEIDNILKTCKKQIMISWGVQDSLEFRMALLSTAILTELMDGICYDLQDGTWLEHEGIFEKFRDEITAYESSIKPQKWSLHEFDAW